MNGVCSEAVPDELKSFYLYLQTGEMPSNNDDAFVNSLDAAVQDAIQKEEVRYQMTLYDEMVISKEKLERVQAEEVQARDNAAQARANAAQARANAEQARAALEHTNLELERAKADADQAKADADQAKADAARIKKAVEELAKLGRNEDAVGVVISEAFRESIFSELGI